MAEKLGASRQAVHDLVSRSRDRLEELESLLGFRKREALLEEEIRTLRRALGERGSREEGKSSPEEEGNV